MNILIIGGSGGIGQALIQHFHAVHPDATIYATYHSTVPDSTARPVTTSATKVHWYQVDITQEADIAALASALPPLSLLINAAGLLHHPEQGPEKSITAFDPQFFADNVNTNTLSTLLLAKHFMPHLKASPRSHFIAFSARIGSIEDNKVGGWISYRCAKAALNMALKTISIEWRFKLPHCCVLAFHPGTTDTALSAPFQKNVPAGKLFSPAYVAECLAQRIDDTGPEDSGQFFSYDGKVIPW
ncbi:SDR family NAD(P)-dependent oxidoreductase [Photobacterium aphoticum]|uniref:C factor cell-cell signaling protein n=1 Tax=Photobacterium aphoticum TaxID=754436 RepID=A0A0J1GU68_9GAMM|nr:SDR family NAD(P)-dependent oxidoreductase [Photobacterium aphoticum]KLV02979.1 C factor cell-cell signaling protein [Photobacterium aphoticum]PSU57903.1 SDR family oxidoreductase [Photobacterium aphoticum]GHA60214.1 SDR family oxidoreductase [Photobacterium aphoticum]